MKRFFIKSIFIAALCLIFAIAVSAQEDKKSTAVRALNGTARTSVIVVGTSAKYAWKATKFTTGKVVKPVVVKAAPATGKFVLKTSGHVVKRSVPVFKKTVVTYVRLRLGI